MGEQTQRFQRRTVLVKRRLQLKYAAIVFAAVVFTALLVGGDITYTMIKFISRENPDLMPQAVDILKLDAVKLLLFMGIMFLVSLFVSHRFAGPIYRFERSAQALAAGDLTHRVSLRTGDDLMELQDEVNAMAASLQQLIQKDRTLAESLSERLKAAAARAPDAMRGELSSIQSELKSLTRGFKV
ncbi:MAG: methyl-accepting chemotaxis protein [Elusimicrobia bacterium]|nr:methyl-accepting chemotaxis protein [Elusimicrobiota bacterium]